MKRVIIIGCPGSGKSTFARELHAHTNLPLYYLDMLYWNADRTTVPKEEFRRRLGEVLEKDSWIIDGNYNATMEMRMAACDTVIFLDYPTEVCISGIRERVGKKREDIPWVETEIDAEFLAFAEKYNTESRPRILELLQHYADRQTVILESRAAADAFLALL